MTVEVRVDELLEERGRSYYWLSKETGISHTTLWRLKKGKALGINFVTLEKICGALGCSGETSPSRRPPRSAAARSRGVSP